VTSKVLRVAMVQLARRGFVVRRHPAVRRQAMFAMHAVDLVLDVGAASGAYGRELREFGYRGSIVSFEPLTAAHSRLARASADDPTWTAVHCALGRESGRTTINVASNSDSSSLLPMAAEHRRAAPQVDYVETEEIEVARLDDAIADQLSAVARPFLKLDTQGFEKEVLEGGPRTLARCVGVQLELSFVELYHGGMLVDEAISMLYRDGFQMVGIAQGMTSPSGQVLQADGVFFRSSSAVNP
jgi:FkbM family methyltransferase